jgi:hypothetical protein
VHSFFNIFTYGFHEGASIDARDHSGKRPKDYLKRNAMPSVKSTIIYIKYAVISKMRELHKD